MIFPLIISALLAYFAFPNLFFLHGFWPFGWIFAYPLFFVLDRQPLRTRAASGLIFGIILYTALTSWLAEYSLIGYILFVLALSLQPVLFACFYPSRQHSHVIQILYIPCAWVASEWIRELLLSGFSWNIANSQSFNPLLIQGADLAGSYGISFVLLLVNYCVYGFLKHSGGRRFYLSLGTAVMAAVIVYGWMSLNAQAGPQGQNGQVTVCTIEPHYDPRQKWDIARIDQLTDGQVALSMAILRRNDPDLIVWPETAIPMDFRQDAVIMEKVRAVIRGGHAPLLIGAALSDTDKDRNSAVLLDHAGRIAGIYDKQYLVPFSEFTPPLPFVSKWMSIYAYDFAAGQQPGIFFLPGSSVQFGVAICSEDGMASFFREYKKGGAQFAVVLLNDAWLSHPAGLMMHAQNAVMRAVENRMPVVRASNSGWSVLIDAQGRVISDIPAGEKKAGFICHEFTPSASGPKFYFPGNMFCGLSLSFVIMNFMLAYRKRKR